MGTQFHSRLSDSDRERLNARIREVLRKAKKTPAPAAGGPAGKYKQRKRVSIGREVAGSAALGNGLLRTVLDVAEKHQFTDAFAASALFPEVLQWLLMLRGDAEFNGFKGVTAQYGLDTKANPIAELGKHLAALIRESSQPDPFRVALSNAAKAVLALAVVSKEIGPSSGTVVSELGRGLARINVQRMISHFIASFVGEFVRSLLRNPDAAEGLRIKEAVDLTDKSIRRLATRTIRRVEAVGAGAFANANGIHAIVLEEVKRFMAQSAPRRAA